MSQDVSVPTVSYVTAARTVATLEAPGADAWVA